MPAAIAWHVLQQPPARFCTALGAGSRCSCLAGQHGLRQLPAAISWLNNLSGAAVLLSCHGSSVGKQ